jgi:hypothetical protein
VTPSVTGFGATDAAWNSSHTADPHSLPGTAYDPDPSLPKVNGGVADRYYAVQHEGGTVTQYEYRFANVPIAAAKAGVLRTEFPLDAKIKWFAVKRGCAQMMVTSKTLGRGLGALVEFSSEPHDNLYNPRVVNDALFLGLPPKTKVADC